ncbi:MAG: pyridoxine 5'-phosphate synthase [Marinilabiliales bacterium]|nr:MAG: pyridoxine 5'-phosphate synthase [Marinilabiliales bacterium]
MIRLSVNINKIATIRNARGGNMPNLVQAAKDLESYGAQGITVHPRPDERHIRYKDVEELKPIISTEFNIEGNPADAFMDLVLKTKPHQVTLVPDDPDQLTSDHGWDTIKHKDFLKRIIKEFQDAGIRTSIFVDPVIEMIEGAKETGTNRIELYTESYAANYHENRDKAIYPFVITANRAKELGLEINAGHDLNLDNLKFFAQSIPFLSEVSIGHALIADALYYGFDNTVNMYLRELK